MDTASALRRAADEIERINRKYPDHERMPIDERRMLAWCHYTCLQTATMLTPVIGEELASGNMSEVRKALDQLLTR